MQIEIVPCLHDNYAYILSDGGADVAVVDPSESEPVLQALAGRRLTAILATHHHHDHVGGNAELCARFPGIPVYGHVAELKDGHRIPEQTQGLADGEGFTVLGFAGRAMHIPGHTLTAIAFHFADAKALFTGDTLFGAGCGRLFEGTPAQMHGSLDRLLKLPADTRVYCGHEYTENNLRFAAAVEPRNPTIDERKQHVAKIRAAGKPSIPFTLAEESATNPFVRVTSPDVIAAAATRDPVQESTLDPAEVLGRIRKWKDSF